jgi:beta-aspartyl-peptidase (threonine type)
MIIASCCVELLYVSFVERSVVPDYLRNSRSSGRSPYTAAPVPRSGNIWTLSLQAHTGRACLGRSQRGLAAFNAEGKQEMDSSIMDGSNLAAGAVAGVQFTKNPISLARAVMERTPHVMLIGLGADALAGRVGLPRMPASYFFTESRWQEFVAVMKQSGRPVPPRPVPGAQSSLQSDADLFRVFAHKFGTVGAVARDVRGNVAAGTSTGGMQGKMPGRVGDSPIIGAATYASNQSCAVSSTGVGEYFIRLAVAKEICALVEYRSLSVQQAADRVIHKEVAALKGGEGGVIVLSARENPVWSFNTLGMFRAQHIEGGQPVVLVEK